jgi:putative endonuclease
VTGKLWYVYLLRCERDTIYTGITTNVIKRFKTHQSGKGAKYTKVNKPIELLASYCVGNRSEASIEEYRVKKLSKKNKLRLIDEKNSNIFRGGSF